VYLHEHSYALYRHGCLVLAGDGSVAVLMHTSIWGASTVNNLKLYYMHERTYVSLNEPNNNVNLIITQLLVVLYNVVNYL